MARIAWNVRFAERHGLFKFSVLETSVTERLREILTFALRNFIVPIVFFVTFRLAGPEPAIAFAVGVAVVQTGVFLRWRIPLNPFFIASSAFTVFFGGLDLVFGGARFYRLSPFFHNLVIGTVLFVSLFTRLSLMEWFAHGLPDRFRPKGGEIGRGYFRKMTLLWVVYFYLKSVFYLWLAFQVDLGELILLRSVIGNISFAIVFLGEIIYRKALRRPTPGTKKPSGPKTRGPREGSRVGGPRTSFRSPPSPP